MAAPKVLFNGKVDIEYHQFYVEPESGEYIELEAAYQGCANGLCGCGSPGRLFLTTGAQNGPVPVAALLFDTTPDLDPYWEEVIEVSLAVGANVVLSQWAREKRFRLALPAGSYRVRYCAMGMDDETEDAQPMDSYCLQFWPAPPGAERILRTTSKVAQYWHNLKMRR